MNLNIKSSKNLILSIIVVLNIITCVVSISESGTIAVFKYGVMLIGVMYFIFFTKTYYSDIKKNINTLSILMVIQFFVLPLVIVLFQGVTESVSNAGISLLFIIFCNILAYSLYKDNRFNNYVQIFFAITFVFIMIAYLKNPVSLNINTIKTNLFDTNNRISRESFGFTAPNTFAILSFTNIILSCYLYNIVYNSNKILKSALLFNNVFMIVLILMTGSRGALISIATFYAVFYVNKTLKRKSTKILIYTCTGILSLYCLNKFFELGLNYSKLSSGRIGNWKAVIRYLTDKDTLGIGFGYVNNNTFYNNGITSRLLTDNWIIHTLATQGLIGVFFGMIIIIYIIVHLFKIKPKLYEEEYNFFVAISISMFTYSIVENMFFSINHIFSMFFWVGIFYYFIKRKNNKL
jgi:hypothetical protein